MKHWILIFSVAMLAACTESKPVKVFYGEKFEAVDPMTPDQLITLLDEEQTAEDVLVEGAIEKSCTHSGCWLTLVNEKGETIFVTYKDEAFTTAKDIKGRKVTLKGSAKKDEQKGEYNIVATGLIIN